MAPDRRRGRHQQPAPPIEVVAFPRPVELVRRAPRLVVGIALLGSGSACMLRANLGVGPWDVLHQGLARHLNISVGYTTIAVGVVILLAWIPLHQRFGIGTAANTLLVGIVLNTVYDALVRPHALWARSILMLIGVTSAGIGTGCYIAAGLGPGPRDGIMTAVSARGHPIWAVRTTLEIFALAGGALLGGTIGAGTVLFALAIGPLAHTFLRLLQLPQPLQTQHETIGVTDE